ncbi:hypothetical protein C1N61_32360 (plasmid) [Priestia aryabhattai]
MPLEEIERVFVVNALPEDLVPFEKKMVYQNYLISTDEKETRIRRQVEEGKEDKCDITIKEGNGLTRKVVKKRINEQTYLELEKNIPEKYEPIIKFRQFFALGNSQVMIDDFVNTKDPLLLAEVEFNTKEEAAEFIPPLWFGKEVTYDDNFKNKNLWKKLNQDLIFNK